MAIRFISPLVLASFVASTAVAEPGWVAITAKPVVWEDSLPLLPERRSVLVLDMPLMTHLRGFLCPSPKQHAFSEPEIRAQIAGLIGALPAQEKVDLKIEWLFGDAKPVDFRRSVLPAAGIVRSTYRLGNSTVTRTVLAPDDENVIFIHLLADQPGALSFRATLSVPGDGEPKIEDRRQLVRPAAAGQPTSLGARVWVLPFESDVAADGNSIVVQGEGEALILITYAAGSDATRPLAETLVRLGNRYDPGHAPPDPSKIWQGVLATQLKSAENSP